MQKKNIWIALLFAMPSIGFSQTLERTVVASAGATISNSSVSIDYNVGETSTNTIQNTGGAVTQGFEQPIVTKGGLSIVPNLNHSCDFEIFPNPTVGNLNYRNNSVNSANYHVEIFDMSGKSFGTFVTNSGMLDVHFLVEGTYLLRIKCGDNSTKTLKFVKI